MKTNRIFRIITPAVIALFSLGCFLSTLSSAAQPATFEKKWLVQGGDTLPYRLLLPVNYNSSKKYPVIFFLHGAGERGNDNQKQLIHGSNLFLKEDIREDFPAIIVFPQCPATSYWSNVIRLHDSTQKRIFYFLKDADPTLGMKLLQQLVNYILDQYPVDKSRVYVGGLSMGGMGTFEIVKRNPGLFAAAFPICGGASPATAAGLKYTSWRIFHGLKDDVVDPAFSKTMAAAIKKQGSEVKLTLYPEANHNSWDNAFAEKDLLPWLFSKHK